MKQGFSSQRLYFASFCFTVCYRAFADICCRQKNKNSKKRKDLRSGPRAAEESEREPLVAGRQINQCGSILSGPSTGDDAVVGPCDASGTFHSFAAAETRSVTSPCSLLIDSASTFPPTSPIVYQRNLIQDVKGCFQ